jgi:hypothetical protein
VEVLISEAESSIAALATQQLVAYNAADLDAFCACYHDEVVVLDGEDQVLVGTEALRERYRGLFENWKFGGEVPQRLDAEPHCVDYETWWRVDPETGERSEGVVLVRYTERDGRIGWVQFFRAQEPVAEEEST